MNTSTHSTMNKTELQAPLTARYDRDNWKSLLPGVFHDKGATVSFDASQVEVLTSAKAAEYRTRNLFRLGDLHLADGKTIALFEAKEQNTRIATNREGMRNLVEREIVPCLAHLLPLPAAGAGADAGFGETGTGGNGPGWGG